jgi:alpha-ketoglutarate-dependent taurine dioxygenase
MRPKLIFLLAFLSVAVHAQELKPYPQADITEAQWAAYYEVVRTKHSADMQDIEEAKLQIFHDANSATSYAFTKPGHPAHPAWITRQFIEKDGHFSVVQIGYFAGKEEPFAGLFRAYQRLNESMREELDRKRMQQPATQSANPK